MTSTTATGADSVEEIEVKAHETVSREAFFPGFDGLRAIAALMVLATHVWLASSYDKPLSDDNTFLSPFFAQLDIGVPVFFVISGFLLYRPFVAARFAGRAAPRSGSFWKRRALRIFPAYWVCFVIVAAFMYHGPLPINSVEDFFTHFFLLQIYTTDRVVGGPVQQSWTLAVEVAFYAFLPAYAWVIRRVRAPRASTLTIELAGVAVLYAASLVYRIALLNADLSSSEFSRYRLWLPGFLDQLALGMGLAVVSAWLAGRARPFVAPRWFAAACWIGAAACFWVVAGAMDLPLNPTGARTAPQFLLEQFVRGLFALALVAPAVFAAWRTGVIRRFLSSAWMVWLGLVSYGIYLWHEAWIDTYLHQRGLGLFQAPVVKLGVFTLVATITTAAVSYYLIERPALALKNRRLRHPWRDPDAVPIRQQIRAFAARLGAFEWALVTIVVMGAAIRFAYIWFERRPQFAEFGVIGDANFYHRGAQLLADGKGFINVFNYDLRGIVQQDASHPPLYILWLAIPSWLGFASTTAHQLWTLIIGVATIVVVGFAGREIAGKRVGLIAAAITAVYPNVWSHDGILTSETMSIFTTTLAVWMGYRYWRVPSLRRAVALGLAVSLAMMARSEMALLVPLVMVPLILRTPARSWRTRWKRFGVASVVVALVVGPWLGYNLARFEKPVGLSTGFGITLLSANCDLTYYTTDIGYWNMGCTLPTEARIQAWNLDQSVAEAEYRHDALEYIANHKKRFAYVTLVHWLRYSGVWDLAKDWDQIDKDIFIEGREEYVAWGSYLMWVVIAPLAVAGTVVLRRRRVPVYIVLAPIVTTLVTITLTFHQNRYRASAETAFSILAAVAVDAIVRRVRSGTPRLAEVPAVDEDQRPAPASV